MSSSSPSGGGSSPAVTVIPSSSSTSAPSTTRGGGAASSAHAHAHRKSGAAARKAAAADSASGGAADLPTMMVNYQRRQARGAKGSAPAAAAAGAGDGDAGEVSASSSAHVKHHHHHGRHRDRDCERSTDDARAPRADKGPRGGSQRRPAAAGAIRLYNPDVDAIPTVAAGSDEAAQRAERERERAALEERRRINVSRALEIKASAAAARERGGSSGAHRKGRRGHMDDDDFGSRHSGGVVRIDEPASSAAGGSRGAAGGQLFDPRRDDPVRFAALAKRAPGVAAAAGSAASHSAHGTQSGASLTSVSTDGRSLASTAPSVTSSDNSRERRRRRGAGSGVAPSDSSEAEGAEGSRAAKPKQSETNSYVMDLKRTYREITTLEAKLKEEHASAKVEDEAGLRKPKGRTADGGVDHEYWLQLAAQHKQLAETHALFMEMALRPGLPASLHSLPQTYSIPTRLWQTAFHVMLERLRHSLPPSAPPHPNAPITADEARTTTTTSSATQFALLDHLVEFIYFAYAFYSNLLESETFKAFRTSWLENLGDLARYRMAVAGLSASLNAAAARASAKPARAAKARFARIDDDGDAAEPAPRPQDAASIGTAALGDWELEEKETWKVTARDWYAKGLAEMPGTGRLHHHLGVLSRGDELRALHHFCKSLTSSHPYLSSRESVLPMFEREHQQRRTQPDATPIDLFVHLHGMLFTRVQLDDFDDVFERFRESLDALALAATPAGGKEKAGAGAEIMPQPTWMMMAAINIAALLQYGAEGALLAPTDGAQTKGKKPDTPAQQGSSPTKRPAASLATDEGDEDEQADETLRAEQAPTPPPLLLDTRIDDEELIPLILRHAVRLTFAILDVVIRLTLAEDVAPLNGCRPGPYATMILTFLSTTLKQPGSLRVLERSIPWTQLVALAERAPSAVDPRCEIASKIGGDVPLPEDWCLRGMAWVGRRVYERGFWKPKGSTSPALVFESEVDVLTRGEGADAELVENLTDREGEDGALDEPDGNARRSLSLSELRWRRAAYALTVLAKTVPGLDFDSAAKGGKGAIVIVDPLLSKQAKWHAEDTQARADVKRMQAHVLQRDEDLSRAALADEEEDEDSPLSDSAEDAEAHEDAPEVRQLKARRRELKAILRAAKAKATPRSPLAPTGPRAKGAKSAPRPQRPPIPIRPGYTILVLDTNIVLTGGGILERLVDSERWTVIVPLAVITELDGIKRNANALGAEAIRALEFLEARLRTHAKWLKIQTSRGNYLPDLRFRTEKIDFAGVEGTDAGGDEEQARLARSMDEIILRAVEWQEKHFVDRRALLARPGAAREQMMEAVLPSTAKAVLVTLDRNLRLKTRIRDCHSIGHAELLHVLLATEKG